jgi:NADP-dependent 3-hydroxy acid dehydrogenase YdfG
MLICSKIGEGTALKFASLGANVVITGRDEIRIKNVAESVEKSLNKKLSKLELT